MRFLAEARLPFLGASDDLGALAPHEDEAEAAPIPGTARLPSYISGHRRRLRERFMSGGADALPDYEMLELVLFRAIPKRDVKPLAHRLLEAFGDFEGVLSAPPHRIRKVEGAGPAVATELKVIEAAAHRLAKVKVMDRTVISSWQAIIDYCRASMAHGEIEQFRVLYLDRKNALIADEAQARGTVDHVPVYPREVAKRAIEIGATALILVHNHPSGDPTPSAADIEMTEKMRETAEVLDIALHDHVVIGRSGEVSFRSEGWL